MYFTCLDTLTNDFRLNMLGSHKSKVRDTEKDKSEGTPWWQLMNSQPRRFSDDDFDLNFQGTLD